MNDNQRNEKKKPTKATPFIILAVYLIVMIVNAAAEETPYILLGVLVLGILFAFFFVIFKIMQKQGKMPSVHFNPSPRKGPGRKPPVEFSDGISSLIERMAKRDEEDCEYGEENHVYSHDDEKRIAQLDNFLKNGIIDREEYNVLKKRYSESGRQ